MPVFWSWDDNGKRVLRYKWPAEYVTPRDGMDDALRVWRREAIADRELFLRYQKELGREARPLLWPVTLAAQLDEISHRLVLRFG